MVKVPAFAPEIYNDVDELVRQTLKVFVSQAEKLLEASELQVSNFSTEFSGDIRNIHNQYRASILASAAAKQASLSIALIESVNKHDYVTYSLIARANLEFVATLRNFVEGIRPTIVEMLSRGTYDSSHVKMLIELEHKYLQGTRFDWVTFFEAGFIPLSGTYAEYLSEKNKKKSDKQFVQMKKWSAGRRPPVEQTSALTCVENWSKEEPGVGVLYDLLCDMVHPNIGSLMCIMVPTSDTGGRFAVRSPKSSGYMLFKLSFAPFWTLVGRELTQCIEHIMYLHLPEDGDSVRTH